MPLEGGENEEMEEGEDNEIEGPQDVGGFTILGQFKAKEKAKVLIELKYYLYV